MHVHWKPREAVQRGSRGFSRLPERGLEAQAGESRAFCSGPPWSRAGAVRVLEAGQPVAASCPLLHAPHPLTAGRWPRVSRACGPLAGPPQEPGDAARGDLPLLLPQRVLGAGDTTRVAAAIRGGSGPRVHGLPAGTCCHPCAAPGSPLSCSMKHTFPLVLNARVSGVMHRVWKMAVWATLLMDRLHSRHTAHASCSLRPWSRRERMSARDTFSCQDRLRLRQVWGQARAQQALLPGKGLAPRRPH